MRRRRSNTNQRFFHDLILPPILIRYPLHIFSERITWLQVSTPWPEDSMCERRSKSSFRMGK